jgi:hypothetical protein
MDTLTHLWLSALYDQRAGHIRYPAVTHRSLVPR